MAASRNFALAALAVLAVLTVASAQQLGLPQLPLLLSPPAECGAIYQVQSGDTCQSIADYAGIPLAYFQQLNPLILCGLLPLVPGSPVCSGDRMAFCNNVYVATPGQTCASINSTVGTIVGFPLNQNCSTLGSTNTSVCIAPPNPCAANTICGVSISSSLQQLLGTVPDYCTILKECQANITTGTTANVSSLTLTISNTTPAVQRVVNNVGHPELLAFTQARSAGPASLAVTFAPTAYTDGNNLISYVGTGSSNGRKLLWRSVPPTGTAKTPARRYY